MREKTMSRNHRGRKYMRFVHGLVYHRSGWQCEMPVCLCPDGRAIDPGLRGTDNPWAPSVDHIVDLAYGGEDNERNMRAAHKLCNQEHARNREHSYGDREPVVNNVGDLFPELKGLRNDT